MKATFEFDLLEEREEYQIYAQAHRLHSAMWDFSQEVLRRLDKYGYFENREMTDEEAKIVEYIREEFYRILRDNEVSLG